MAERPVFRHQDSEYAGQSYEMKSMDKPTVKEVSAHDGGEEDGDAAVTEKNGTREDQKDMYRMNKVCQSIFSKVYRR